MKANELKIGNLVLYSDSQTVFFVNEINQNGIWVENKEESTWVELDQFEPIPLTEEWLLKFGFELNETTKRGTIYEATHARIEWIADKLYWMSENYINPDNSLFHIQYVHQFQNLYFALTGNELTLKET